MKNTLAMAVTVAVATMLGACSPNYPPTEVLRPVRTAEIRYDAVREANHYAGTVQSRHEVEHAFRIGGKVVQRKVDVGQFVHEGDVLAVLDDTDYRLAEDASHQQWQVAATQARQAESDRRRLSSLKGEGSVSAADDERAASGALAAQATEQVQARQFELARNRVNYTVLRASRSGVVTAVRMEVGQVVAEGLPIVAIADPDTAEIVVDVPEDQLAVFRKAKFKATLASMPDESFELALRELAPQAAAQTRTYRARLKPVVARVLPLGATATLLVDRVVTSDAPLALLPASALTQVDGQPALWVVKRAGQAAEGSVELVRVKVHGYRNEDVLVSGPQAGQQVVIAGVQKMAPGLKVALPSAVQTNKTEQVAR